MDGTRVAQASCSAAHCECLLDVDQQVAAIDTLADQARPQNQSGNPPSPSMTTSDSVLGESG